MKNPFEAPHGHEDFRNTIKELNSLEKQFFYKSTSEEDSGALLSNMAILLDGLEKERGKYFSPEERAWVDLRQYGTIGYFMGNLEKKDLKELWR